MTHHTSVGHISTHTHGNRQIGGWSGDSVFLLGCRCVSRPVSAIVCARGVYARELLYVCVYVCRCNERCSNRLVLHHSRIFLYTCLQSSCSMTIPWRHSTCRRRDAPPAHSTRRRTRPEYHEWSDEPTCAVRPERAVAGTVVMAHNCSRYHLVGNHGAPYNPPLGEGVASLPGLEALIPPYSAMLHLRSA